MSNFYPENQRQRRLPAPDEYVDEAWVDDEYAEYDDELYYEEEYALYSDEMAYYEPYPPPTAVARGNGMTIVGIAFLVLIAISIFRDQRPLTTEFVSEAPITITQQGGQPTAVASSDSAPASVPVKTNPVYPYEEYTITQGVHGFSYGHMAIDIAAGEGATIMSPIDGEITALYTDEWGNPTLVIENDFYQITFLHGKYSVVLGEQVRQGQPIGSESNLGYTMDMQGNLCYGRNCGYHSHLNIFDKQLGTNVNPLDILQ